MDSGGVPDRIGREIPLFSQCLLQLGLMTARHGLHMLNCTGGARGKVSNVESRCNDGCFHGLSPGSEGLRAKPRFTNKPWVREARGQE